MCKNKKMVVFLMSLGLLSGCGSTSSKKDGWFRDRSEDYHQAMPLPKMKIPKDIRSDTFSDEYDFEDIED